MKKTNPKSETLNSKQIISIILIFAFATTNVPFRDSPLAGRLRTPLWGQSLSHELSPQSRTTNPLVQRQFAKAASHIEKVPEPDTFDADTLANIKKGTILIRLRLGAKKRATQRYAAEVETKIDRAFAGLVCIYGWGLVGKVKSVLVVPHLRGHSLAYLIYGRKIRLDARVVDGNSPELLRDQVEHETWRALLREIDDNIGIQEMVAIFQSLRRFADPYYDDIKAIRAFERGGLELSDTRSVYQNGILDSLALILGLDPDGLAAKLYKDTKGYSFDDPKDAEEILKTIGAYIFCRKGCEAEQEALKKLRAEGVDVVGRAMQALQGLNARRIRFMVENRVLDKIDNWDEMLRLRKLSHAHSGVQDVREEIHQKLDNVITELGIQGILPEEKSNIAFGVAKKILNTTARLIHAVGSSVLAVKDAPVFITDAAEAERRMRAVAERHKLDWAIFEKHRYTIFLEFLYHNLFESAILMRNRDDIDKVEIIFRKKVRSKGSGDQVYKAIVSAKGKNGRNYVQEAELPVFLNELWMLLDNCLIDIEKGAEENDIWRILEDMIEYAKDDPIGARLLARGVKSELQEDEFIVIEEALLNEDDARRIDEINEARKRIFVMSPEGLNAQAALEAIQKENKAANRENTVFVVGAACAMNGIIREDGEPNFIFFETENGAGIDQMIRLANGILEDEVSVPDLLKVTEKLNPRLYARMDAVYGGRVLESRGGDLFSGEDIFASRMFIRVMP